MPTIRVDPAYRWRLAGIITVSLLLTGLALVFAEADVATLLCAAMALNTGVLLLIVAVANKGARRRATLFALVVYALVPALLFTRYLWIREHARWLVLARSYETRLLAQPVPPNGEFKHVVWDGWGITGQDTDVFLVFDPTNSLAVTASERPPRRAPGLPCSVRRVIRLESQWYAVVFYTNTFWVHGTCT